jgi:hypothetical protein
VEGVHHLLHKDKNAINNFRFRIQVFLFSQIIGNIQKCGEHLSVKCNCLNLLLKPFVPMAKLRKAKANLRSRGKDLRQTAFLFSPPPKPSYPFKRNSVFFTFLFLIPSFIISDFSPFIFECMFSISNFLMVFSPVFLL